MKQLHGGDWAAYEREYKRSVLDFSASVSPLGMPTDARRAAEEALAQAERYPDPACMALRMALAHRHGVPAEQIVCGNGAAELIHRLCLVTQPRRALLPEPCFAEYRRALEAVACEIQSISLNEELDFALPEELWNVQGEADILFLCQPNNPTGRTVPPEQLRQILRRCEQRRTLLVLDECFVELLDEPERFSLIPELAAAPELVILRAFTKSYAMAGLRLGYALCGSVELAERLRRSGQPWPVSQMAQEAGLAALGDTAYRACLRDWIRTERPRLYAGLTALGFRVIPGEANFLLFWSADTALGEKLCEHGILLRDCRDFPGLGPGWYRTAVRTKEENGVLLRALEEVIHG